MKKKMDEETKGINERKREVKVGKKNSTWKRSEGSRKRKHLVFIIHLLVASLWTDSLSGIEMNEFSNLTLYIQRYNYLHHFNPLTCSVMWTWEVTKHWKEVCNNSRWGGSEDEWIRKKKKRLDVKRGKRMKRRSREESWVYYNRKEAAVNFSFTVEKWNQRIISKTNQKHLNFWLVEQTQVRY